MQTGFLPFQHDHDRCKAGILGKADAICRQKKVRLTPQRREVLAILSGSHRCLGAYDILGQMNGRTGRRLAPMAVYRSLEFLMDMGLVHRVGIRNAYFACTHPGHDQRPQFWICRHCDCVVETESYAIANLLPQVAQDIGFNLETVNVELVGVCSDCKGEHS
ncbi:MAG: transcriptional regulator np20 [Magnetococcales bacterium]|nr:transcriptional regulator np20 [Magnetococcales bacterium]HIJ83891.1 transcriptional repressor [Magnetococcales bacterium]